LWVLNVRAEARTYLRGDSKGNSNGNGKSNRRSFDCDSRDEAARVFAQDDNLMGWQEKTSNGKGNGIQRVMGNQISRGPRVMGLKRWS
jgi:hypothetical protein